MQVTAKLFKVTIIESDSWSGQKVLDRQFFTTHKEAMEVANPINAKNVCDKTPEYYIFATVDPVN